MPQPSKLPEHQSKTIFALIKTALDVIPYSKTHTTNFLDDSSQCAKITCKFKIVAKNTNDVILWVNASLDFSNIIANLYVCQKLPGLKTALLIAEDTI